MTLAITRNDLSSDEMRLEARRIGNYAERFVFGRDAARGAPQ